MQSLCDSDLLAKGLPISLHAQEPAVPNDRLLQLFHFIPKPDSLLTPLLQLYDGSFSPQLEFPATANVNKTATTGEVLCEFSLHTCRAKSMQVYKEGHIGTHSAVGTDGILLS